MKTTINQQRPAITHEAADLMHKALRMAKRYGKRNGEGGIDLRMTPRAFALAFGYVDDMRDAIDRVEAACDRIGFFLMPDHVVISVYDGGER